MRKLNLIVVLVLLINYTSIAQVSMKAFLANQVDVTFLGYDFSQARFIGSEGFNEPEKIKDNYLPGLNDLIVNEEKKYSIREPFKIKSEHYKTSIDHNKNINNGVDVHAIITNDNYTLNKNKLNEVVANYEFGSMEGIGISYIVESLNKNEKTAYVYIVFIDLKKNELLHAEKAQGKARGFGWRNYWAGAMYDINKNIKKSYYKQISKQYK